MMLIFQDNGKGDDEFGDFCCRRYTL